MEFPEAPRGRERTATIVAIAACTALAAWLRLYDLSGQVVLDDEWHALVKLMGSGYGDIARSFGYADHSIPLTLLYKAIASTVGLTELRMRGLQVLFGTALVPFAAWLAWRATRDGAVAALYALTLAASSFLVLYSRVARPYAITTFLACAVLALLWRWRSAPGWRVAAAACVLGALSTWLHPISGLYPATACVFLAAEALVAREARGPRLRRAIGLGVAMALAMALPVLPPLLADFGALSAKAGTDHAGLATVARMLALFSGVLPAAAAIVVVGLAVAGAGLLVRRDRPLGAYLVVVAIVPPLVVAAVGASWSFQGHTFARYVFPLQLVMLGWASFGAVAIARGIARRHAAAAGWIAAGVLGAAYLALAPTIGQVVRYGAWFGHIYYQYDFDPAHNRARTNFRKVPVPAFYEALAKLPPRSLTVIDAPFSYEAPYNLFAWFDEVGGQRAKAGLLSSLCHAGVHEVPEHDPRFRFRSFVFLDDPAAVRASGARYLVLHLEQVDGHAFEDAPRCVEALTRLYGPPVTKDARIAAWDLAR